MKIAISQPTFMPWAGYIALIDHVDEFIFLDNVQFEKRSWQQRNYIKLDQKKFILTVPVLSKGKRYQKINETEIDYGTNFVHKHLNNLKHSYSKSNYYKLYSEDIFKIYRNNYNNISDLNIKLIKYFCKIIKISTKFDYSSNLKSNGFKLNLIINLCLKKKCSQYITTIGSKDYIKNDDLFKKNNINLKFYDFRHEKYAQKGKHFIENLSFIDLLFNLGEGSLEYLRRNFKITNNK